MPKAAPKQPKAEIPTGGLNSQVDLGEAYAAESEPGGLVAAGRAATQIGRRQASLGGGSHYRAGGWRGPGMRRK